MTDDEEEVEDQAPAVPGPAVNLKTPTSRTRRASSSTGGSAAAAAANVGLRTRSSTRKSDKKLAAPQQPTVPVTTASQGSEDEMDGKSVASK